MECSFDSPCKTEEINISTSLGLWKYEEGVLSKSCMCVLGVLCFVAFRTPFISTWDIFKTKDRVSKMVSISNVTINYLADKFLNVIFNAKYKNKVFSSNLNKHRAVFPLLFNIDFLIFFFRCYHGGTGGITKLQIFFPIK